MSCPTKSSQLPCLLVISPMYRIYGIFNPATLAVCRYAVLKANVPLLNQLSCKYAVGFLHGGVMGQPAAVRCSIRNPGVFHCMRWSLFLALPARYL